MESQRPPQMPCAPQFLSFRHGVSATDENAASRDSSRHNCSSRRRRGTHLSQGFWIMAVGFLPSAEEPGRTQTIGASLAPPVALPLRVLYNYGWSMASPKIGGGTARLDRRCAANQSHPASDVPCPALFLEARVGGQREKIETKSRIG